jgi:hypothetical protein
VSFPLASFLLIIEELQKFAIVSRLATNPTISQSAEMEKVDMISRYLLLDVTSPDTVSRQILLAILVVVQVMVTAIYLFPLREETLRKLAARMVVILQMTLTIPSILLSIESLARQDDIAEAALLMVASLGNSLAYCIMQLECSFTREDDNVLVRAPSSLSLHLLQLGNIALFPLLAHLLYPTSFLIYILINLVGVISQWWTYLRDFIYFQEQLTKLKGILLSVNISANLCYLSIDTLSNAIISQNVLIFITAFSIFLGNFFSVFRNYLVKNTIINQELRN